MSSGTRNRTNLNLTLPFVDERWTGQIRLLEPASPVAFIARDEAGRTGRSPLIRPRVPDDLAVHLEVRPENFMFQEEGAFYVAIVTNPGPSTSRSVFLNVELDGALARTRIGHPSARRSSATICGPVSTTRCRPGAPESITGSA